ncbi:MAG: sugar ABC transporter permease [Treponema sp.]|jgi:multiple sugar transport system permease protein|nr:sugar ABC transporter permease [Treponema sp.]
MTKRISIFQRVEPLLYLVPSAIIMLLILGYPIIYNMGISFFNWTLRDPERTFTGLKNYIDVLTDTKFFTILWNTVLWTALGVILQMIVGIGMALFADGLKSNKAFLRTIMLVPWLIPGVVTALIWKFMLQSDVGIINFIQISIGISDENILFMSDPKIAIFTLILVNVWKAAPFWFLMITAALQNKPIDQMESARLDGAKFHQVIRHIILPHLTPVIASTGVLTTIWTLNYFDLIWSTTKGGPMDSTTTMPIYTYRLAFEQFNFGRSAAMAVVSLVLVCIVCVPYVKKMFGNLKEEGTL